MIIHNAGYKPNQIPLLKRESRFSKKAIEQHPMLKGFYKKQNVYNR